LILGTLAWILLGCSGGDRFIERKDLITEAPVQSPVSPVVSSIQGVGVLTSTPKILSPDSDKGTVAAIIYDEPNQRPFADRSIYLAQLEELNAPDGSQVGLIAVLDVTSDPFAQTDETGGFVIENVEPGKYALAVRLPNLRELLLHDAGTGNNLIIEVMPGEILDMGVVSIREQP
jgi:hypothetical protein